MIGVLIYFVNFYQPATCFDLVMNGAETGVDCGGDCVRICEPDVLPPQLVWAKSFEIVPGQYNAVAYVENQNQTAGTPELRYTFEFLNNGQVVAERSGTTVLPPNSVYPIFEGRILTDARQSVTETRLRLETAELWLPASVGRDQFRVLDRNLLRFDTEPRLDVEIENTALTRAEEVEVVATIFNDAGEAVTASETLIEDIPSRTSQNITFTWPQPIAKTVRNCVIPTDVAVAIDLSGSMNNDGGTPPEPISSTLAAASQFVTTLQADDQVALVTFATESVLETPLTESTTDVATTIQELTITPAEETGFTNTVAALLTAQSALNSDLHNPNARRVLVLLTDGLPTAAGDRNIVAEATTTAAALDADGIEIYAIGLGEGVDEAFVVDIASTRDNAYFAPTGADLAEIYAEITSALCESGPTKIDVIAKTKTNFAPLE